jgi:hypothetical protein
VSKTLPPRRDLWGREIERPGTAVERTASPLPLSPDRRDPVDIEMIRLGLDNKGVPGNKYTYNGIQWQHTPERYDEMLKAGGELPRQFAEKVMASPGYARMGDEQKKELLNKYISAAQTYSEKMAKIKGIKAGDSAKVKP